MLVKGLETKVHSRPEKQLFNFKAKYIPPCEGQSALNQIFININKIQQRISLMMKKIFLKE